MTANATIWNIAPESPAKKASGYIRPQSPRWVEQRAPAAGNCGLASGWIHGNCVSVPAGIQRMSALERTFQRLADRWRMETGKFSLTKQKILHPAYQRIIGMRRAALPFILRRLKDHDEDWFWALMAITGENLFREGQTLADARQAWIEWGKSENLL